MKENLTIFDELYPKFKITKPIRLIEFFAGYGSQALALKYLNVSFEHWVICEWAIKSIQAYKDMHFTNDNYDYSCIYENKGDLVDHLYKLGISANYNEPMTKQQISKLNDKQIRTIYNNIRATHNLVNIQNIHGNDLKIVDVDKYDYILTYSFPCQDLSLAGKGKGMSDNSTRSGMLWEVERILTECYELGTLPQILLMENVPQVHGTDNVKDFNKWQLRLEELGYKNYFQDLIATDYGIPQTRNRCFMISILGDYSYTFPKSKPLGLKLRDMLEDNVDEKYYLSDKMLNYCFGINQKNSKFPRKERFLQSLEQTNDKNIATTITTNAGNRPTDNFIKENNMKTQLCNNLIKDGKVKENDVIRHSYTTSRMNGDMKDLKQNNLSPTLDTRCDCLGVCVKGIATNESEEWQKPPLEEKSRTLLANKSNAGVGIIGTDLRIRKLTPKECFRLMGVKDEDFEKCTKNQSNSSLYHLAGDSIVVNVLMAIFKELI